MLEPFLMEKMGPEPFFPIRMYIKTVERYNKYYWKILYAKNGYDIITKK